MSPAKTFVIHMPSEVTAAAEKALMDSFGEASRQNARDVALDFGKAALLDVGGASLLVRLSVEARKRRQNLKAVGLGEHYRQIFKLTGLNKVIHADESSVDAVTGAIQPMDVAQWAKPVSRLEVRDMPAGATNVNVEGRRVLGPLEGFGPMWHKTYQVRLGTDITPIHVIRILKERFPEFQPPENRFYASKDGVKPGAVLLINASTPAGPMCTGVMVLHADDKSFDLITPQGHPLAGWVSFSSYQDEGITVAQVQGLARSSDPLYELGFRIAGSKKQENIWKYVLASLAQHLGLEPHVEMHKTCIDPRFQWSKATNAWYNAQVRTTVYTIVAAPGRWLRRLIKR